ncbi:MAG TPA: GAF domain-containing sensor histidine kinase [bacterium]|nr:GAF domain-containing sensor histidine kinase [bacterium]
MPEHQREAAAAKQPARVEDPHIRELRILNAIAEALNSSPDVQQALERTLGLVADLLGLRTGWVWLRDVETGQFYNAAARNLPPYLQAPVRMTGHQCWCIEEFNEGALTPKNIDVLECSRLRPAVQRQATDLTHGLAYHASVPLYFQDKPLGILNVTGPSWRRLTDEELHLLSTIAYQVGIAIERARLADESAQLARAEERARLAREIHDTLAQGLTAIALHLEGALHHLTAQPERARQRLQRALLTTRESLEDARRSVLDLRASPLTGKPLLTAVRALSRKFTSETGIRVRVRGEATTRPLPMRVEAELYRIAQEALVNVRRHAEATDVEIALQQTPRRVRLSVRDNGHGFDPRAVSAGRHGLVGMRERAKLLGGTLRVTSRRRPPSGTTVVAYIPISRVDGNSA